jgi:2-methylisocitrate lyase-like PEP mutase family enzyme
MRSALAAGQLLVAPGCYDVLTAKVLLACGLLTAYLTPFGFRATDEIRPHAPADPWDRLLGRAEELAAWGGIAVIVDAHTGLEGDRAVDVRVRDCLAAGAAAVIIEDRTGFGSACELRPAGQMRREISRARAAAQGRGVLIVRSDAVRSSLPQARERCEQYLEEGADLVMPLMTPYLAHPDTERTREARMRAYAFLLERLPASRLVVHSPYGRHMTVAEARTAGYAVYLMPQLLVAAASTSMRHELESVLRSEPGLPLTEPAELAEFAGIGDWLKARW